MTLSMSALPPSPFLQSESILTRGGKVDVGEGGDNEASMLGVVLFASAPGDHVTASHSGHVLPVQPLTLLEREASASMPHSCHADVRVR